MLSGKEGSQEPSFFPLTMDQASLPNDMAHSGRCRGTLGLYAVTCLSGFAGLGYELTWTRMLGLALGHEIVAALCVVMGFFGGVALGSFILGGRIGRSGTPALWYAGLEAAIAVWALAQTGLLPWLGHLIPALLGPDPSAFAHWAVAFGTAFLALLPATFAMGATLPALVAVLDRIRPGTTTVGAAYAANTFGAMAGTLLSTFVIAPILGFTATLVVLAGVNAICAAAAFAWREQPRAQGSVTPPAAMASGLTGLRILATLFVTGFLGIGYEVLVVRVLSQLMENTVYTFAVLLAVYLLGTALGGAIYARLRQGRPASSLLNALLVAASAVCWLGTAMLFGADILLAALRQVLPATLAGGVGAEAVLGAAVFLPPSVAMGALFSHLGQLFTRQGRGLGMAVGWNTLGAAAAPVLFGLILLPAFGAKSCLAAVAIGYALLAWPSGWFLRAAAGLPALAALALVVWPGRLQFTSIPPGGLLVEQVDGVMASVAVIQDQGGERRLQVNSHFRMGGTATARLDRRQALLPLLLHPDPKRALFLGLGTGTTVAAAAGYPGLQTDGVELVPEILSVLRDFEKSAGALAASPRLTLHVADARRFVRATPDRYDVIVADLYHPSLDGSGTLYTREHFDAVRQRLAPGGVFCQWLPLHQLDLPTLRVILRSFLQAFPNASAYMANFGLETPLIALIGQDDPLRYGPGWVEGHMRDNDLRQALSGVGFTDDLSLFGGFISDAAGLAAFAGPGEINTDDHPVITFLAPGMVYVDQEKPVNRLMEFLGQLHPVPAQVLRKSSADVGELPDRLAAYWRARDRFLEVGKSAMAASDARDPIARVAPELLAILRISPDFDPAYFPLLAMARSLAGRDIGQARRLLADLDRAAPDRSDAADLLAHLR